MAMSRIRRFSLFVCVPILTAVGIGAGIEHGGWDWLYAVWPLALGLFIWRVD